MRIECQPLSVRGRRAGDLGERRTGAYRNREVARFILDDSCVARRDNGRFASHRTIRIEPAPATDDSQRPPMRYGFADAIAHLGCRGRGDADARGGRQARSSRAARADGAMCHSRHECTGTTFPGFARRAGSNTSRKEHMARRDSLEKRASI